VTRLWTISGLRPQILYGTDISTVVMELDLGPGSVVVETGTGSGSLSHALIRTVAPTGHVHTFEFHEERARIARTEFEAHGLAEHVTVTHADACEDGFGLEDCADAVFLDLPKPWLALEHARRALRQDTGGRICSFSPCIEQVQRTCEGLRLLGFIDIQTFSSLEREYDVRARIVQQANLSAPQTKVLRDFLPGFDPAMVVDQPAAGSKPVKVASASPSAQMPGHTGYLSFATFPPQRLQAQP
jgi:tRNA (adenine57-N1/adenine58-N1)-methyltransferase